MRIALHHAAMDVTTTHCSMETLWLNAGVPLVGRSWFIEVLRCGVSADASDRRVHLVPYGSYAHSWTCALLPQERHRFNPPCVYRMRANVNLRCFETRRYPRVVEGSGMTGLRASGQRSIRTDAASGMLDRIRTTHA